MLVTGAGTGIGRAVAEALLQGGGTVVALGRREAPLRSLAEAYPGKVHVLSRDLGDARARTGIVARAAELAGSLDGFVHSAGIVVHQPPGSIDDDHLRQQIEVNLIAPLRLGEEALQILEPGGAMVFVSSTLAERPLSTSAAYSASKAGMVAAMKSLALAGAPRRIRASAVSPGLVDTDMIRTLRTDPGEPVPQGDEHERRLAAQLVALRTLHPLGRLGTPEDVAAGVIHLLGAAWVTGTNLLVDGGLMLRE